MLRWGLSLFWTAVVCLSFAYTAEAQDKLELSPNRPTVANSAAVQGKGVLQVEFGYDTFPQTPLGEQQAVETALYYTPWERARLDLTWTTFSLVHSADEQASGLGTVQLGTKIVLVKDGTHPRLPGLGFQYGAELPAASADALQGYGQQAAVLMNHHFGKVNLIVNGSIVQSDCQTRSGCSYGGQQSMAVAYRLRPHTSLYSEVFAQNVGQSNAPPGTYVLAAVLHRFSDSFGVNAGLRFGVSDHSSSIGTTVGVFFGKRLKSAR